MTDSTGKWRAIQDEFLATGDAAAAGKSLTTLRDESVTRAFHTAVHGRFPHGAAILAGGAYGRGYTFPYSELDIVLLADSSQRGEELKDALPEFVRLLWNDALRPNASVQTVAECAEALDRASATAFVLLDRRYLDGDRALFELLDSKMPAALSAHREKLRQRLSQAVRTRHASHGNTSCEAQPDTKESPGGMQDARAISWLALLKGENRVPPGDLAHAAAVVARARCFLHYYCEGDHNVLDYAAQSSLAKQKFAFDLREYFQCARIIYNHARRSLDEAEKGDGSLLENILEYRARFSSQEFTLSRDRLLLRSPDHIAEDPAVVLRLLEFIARHGAAPSADTERKLEAARDAFAAWGAQPRPVWASLKAVLGAPHAGMALRVLQSTGLMRSLLPEWDVVEGVVIASSEYPHTLDERTLRNIEAVLELTSGSKPERQRFAGLLAEIDDLALLVFVLLFAEMGDTAPLQVRSAGVRMQMPAEVLAAAEFLTAQRSTLADAVNGRDLDDPATVRQLADRVGTSERLRAIVMMSFGRVAGSSPADKIAWRLHRLWQAYTATQHELLRELETDRIDQVPVELPPNAAFLKGFPQRYLRAHPAAEIQAHVQLYEQSRPTGVAVNIEPLGAAYRITIVARDKPSVFVSFAGAISSFGLDILKAEAFSNAAGVILDTFVVADPKRMLQLNPPEADRLRDLLQRVATGRTDPQKLMRGRTAPDPNRRGEPPRVQFDAEACPTATLVEIDAEDRPGLLFSLASVFSSSACNIDIVLVDTRGQRAIDVFYVAHEGHKLPPEMQDRLKEKLLAAC